jgi:hypothetical protein
MDVEDMELLGMKEIVARAWDEDMNTQPKDLTWNVMGNGKSSCPCKQFGLPAVDQSLAENSCSYKDEIWIRVGLLFLTVCISIIISSKCFVKR